MVSSFQLSFYNGTEWVDQWDSRSTGKLPKQVRITLEMSDGNKTDIRLQRKKGSPAPSNEEGFVLVTVLLIIAILFPLVLAFGSRVQVI